MAKEYIERDALIELANNHEDGVIDAYDIALFPSADVVEVVRCKDCKHYEPCEGGKDYCCWHATGIVKDDFCSYGERRVNDGDKENL